MSNNHKDIFDRKACKLPRYTYEALEKAGIKDIENFNLKLNKFGYFDEKHGFQVFKKNGKGKKIKPNFSKDLILNINDRQKVIAESFLGGDYVTKDFTSDWRFITGLGQDSVYENGITLHHIYGVPYIPASSLKGCIRSYVIQEVFDIENGENSNISNLAEGKAIQCKTFCQWFGCPESIDINGQSYLSALNGKAYQGELIFFDAFPVEIPKIEPDIMNNHYPDYYDGHAPPADWQSPRPINFLTVENTTFRFYIGSRGNKDKINGKTIDEWLTEALKNQGIGAKTAIGYGYFNNND